MRGLTMGGLALLTLAGCGVDSSNGTGANQHGATAETYENTPGGLPIYPQADPDSVNISDMTSSRLPTGRVARFRTNDTMDRVADFYASTGERAGYQVQRLRDTDTTFGLVLRNETLTVQVNGQRRPEGVTTVQVGARPHS